MLCKLTSESAAAAAVWSASALWPGLDASAVLFVFSVLSCAGVHVFEMNPPPPTKEKQNKRNKKTEGSLAINQAGQ